MQRGITGKTPEGVPALRLLDSSPPNSVEEHGEQPLPGHTVEGAKLGEGVGGGAHDTPNPRGTARDSFGSQSRVSDRLMCVNPIGRS